MAGTGTGTDELDAESFDDEDEDEDEEEEEEVKRDSKHDDRMRLNKDLIPSSKIGFLAYATDELLQRVDETEDLEHAEAMLATIKAIRKQKNVGRRDEFHADAGPIVEALHEISTRILKARVAEQSLAKGEARGMAEGRAEGKAESDAKHAPELSVLLDEPLAVEIARTLKHSLYTRVVQVSSASASGGKTKMHYVQPVKVEVWSSFDTDVFLGEPLAPCFQVGISRGYWSQIAKYDCGVSEASALSDFSEGVFLGIKKTYAEVGSRRPRAQGAKAVDPTIRVVLAETTWMAGRVDATWTRAHRKDDKRGLAALSTFRMVGSDKRMVFLVHEHKAQWAFPYAPPGNYIELMDEAAGARSERNRERDERRASLASQGIDFEEVEKAEKANGEHERRLRKQRKQRKEQKSKKSKKSKKGKRRKGGGDSDGDGDRDEEDGEDDEKSGAGGTDLNRIRFDQQLDLPALWKTFKGTGSHPYLFKFVAPIIQVYTYMIHSALKYAVLSTMESTWFLRRDQVGTLFIAGPFDVAAQGPDSVRNAYFRVVGRAQNDLEAVGYGILRDSELHKNMKVDTQPGVAKFADGLAGVNPSIKDALSASESLQKDFAKVCRDFINPPPSQGKTENRTENAALLASLAQLRARLPLAAADFQAPMSFETCENLVFSQRTIVDRCDTVGIPMIYKRWTYSLTPRWPDENEAAEASFTRERDMYEGPLSPLQGLSIPLLIYAGAWAFQPYVLAVSDEGDSLRVLIEVRLTEAAEAAGEEEVDEYEVLQPLFDAHFLSALDALQALHGCGVLHGDIDMRNIVIHPDRGAKFIDFEMSRESEDPADFEQETALLFVLFNQTLETAAALEEEAAAASASTSASPPVLKKRKSWRSLLPSFPRSSGSGTSSSSISKSDSKSGASSAAKAWSAAPFSPSSSSSSSSS